MKRKIILAVLVGIVSIWSGKDLVFAKDTQSLKYNELEAIKIMSTLDIEEEIKDAKENKISDNVDEEILEEVMVDSDKEDVDISYTVDCLGEVNNFDGSVGKIYSLTATGTKKTSKGTVKVDNVDCWINLTWMDNLGTSNKILYVAGGWTPNGRTLSNRQVLYGVTALDGSFIGNQYEIQRPTQNSYHFFPTKTLSGLYLTAYSWVDSAGYPYSIYCGVGTSVFD